MHGGDDGEHGLVGSPVEIGADFPDARAVVPVMGARCLGGRIDLVERVEDCLGRGLAADFRDGVIKCHVDQLLISATR